MSAGNYPYPDWLTLRELDAAAGARKGSAFLAFKRLAPAFADGVDYVTLHHQNDRERIAALRSQDRLYASSVNVVVLAAKAARAVAEALRSSTDMPR